MIEQKKMKRFLWLFKRLCEGFELLAEIDDKINKTVDTQNSNITIKNSEWFVIFSVIRGDLEKSIAETLKEMSILLKGDEEDVPQDT